MKVQITATREEVESRAVSLANLMWARNFDDSNALSLISSIFPELVEQEGFRQAFATEWDRMWNA